ncbi:MAG: hypothetical protein GEU99_17625 [Luteitalea sp.]|nr:hypothetical protein [Luteitalea sp.]
MTNRVQDAVVPRGIVPAAIHITSVDYRMVQVPFWKPNHWASGKRSGTTRLIIQVHTSAGITGIGETICLWDFVEPVLRNTIVPLVVGQDLRIEKISRLVEGAGYYHHKRAMVAALAGVEMALWDIIGKLASLPLHQVWGGAFRDRVPLVAYLQCASAQEAAAEAASSAERGFRTVKLKIGMDEDSDISIVRAAREAVGSTIRLRADVNGAWTVGTAKRQLRRLEDFDLEYVEQPLACDDLQGHAYLRRISPIPIALDESAYTLQDVHNILHAEAADVIVLDPHQAGGLQQTRKAAAAAEAAGIPVTLHSGGELGVSTAAYLHLAAVTPNVMLAIDSHYSIQTADIVMQPHTIHEGSMGLPCAPGLGMELHEGEVERHRVERVANTYLDPDRPGWFPTKPQY